MKELEHFQLRQQQDGQKGDLVLQQLSLSIRNDIKKEYFGKILQKYKLLKLNFSDSFIEQLSLKLKEVFLSPDEIVLQQGELLNKVFCLVTGELIVYQEKSIHQSENLVVGKIKKGEFTDQRAIFFECNIEYGLKSAGISQLVYFTNEDFINTLKAFPQEYEKYCMLKDNMIFQEKYIDLKCYCCGQYGHQTNKCSMVHYVADRESTIMKQSNTPQIQIRKTYQRQNVKYKTLQKRIQFSQEIRSFKIQIIQQFFPYYQLLLPKTSTDEIFSTRVPEIFMENGELLINIEDFVDEDDDNSHMLSDYQNINNNEDSSSPNNFNISNNNINNNNINNNNPQSQQQQQNQNASYSTFPLQKQETFITQQNTLQNIQQIPSQNIQSNNNNNNINSNNNNINSNNNNNQQTTLQNYSQSNIQSNPLMQPGKVSSALDSLAAVVCEPTTPKSLIKKLYVKIPSNLDPTTNNTAPNQGSFSNLLALHSQNMNALNSNNGILQNGQNFSLLNQTFNSQLQFTNPKSALTPLFQTDDITVTPGNNNNGVGGTGGGNSGNNGGGHKYSLFQTNQENGINSNINNNNSQERSLSGSLPRNPNTSVINNINNNMNQQNTINNNNININMNQSLGNQSDQSQQTPMMRKQNGVAFSLPSLIPQLFRSNSNATNSSNNNNASYNFNTNTNNSNFNNINNINFNNNNMNNNNYNNNSNGYNLNSTDSPKISQNQINQTCNVMSAFNESPIQKMQYPLMTTNNLGASVDLHSQKSNHKQQQQQQQQQIIMPSQQSSSSLGECLSPLKRRTERGDKKKSTINTRKPSYKMNNQFLDSMSSKNYGQFGTLGNTQQQQQSTQYQQGQISHHLYYQQQQQQQQYGSMLQSALMHNNNNNNNNNYNHQHSFLQQQQLSLLQNGQHHNYNNINQNTNNVIYHQSPPGTGHLLQQFNLNQKQTDYFISDFPYSMSDTMKSYKYYFIHGNFEIIQKNYYKYLINTIEKTKKFKPTFKRKFVKSCQQSLMDILNQSNNRKLSRQNVLELGNNGNGNGSGTNGGNINGSGNINSNNNYLSSKKNSIFYKNKINIQQNKKITTIHDLPMNKQMSFQVDDD